MPIKTDRELAAPQRDLFTRARAASESKNYDYAITLLQSLLKTEPTFLEGRQRLRSCEITKFKSQSSISRQTSSAKASMSGLRLNSAVKKNPTEALALIEDVLAMDPFNATANNALVDAAKALELLPMAAFAYETIAQGNPKDVSALLALGQLYMTMGDPVKAETTYTRILDVDPINGEAMSGQKNASAAQASKKGGFDTAKDYRDVLKDKEASARLEQQGKVVKSSEAIDAQIAQLHQKSQEEPTNPLHAKRIAELCVQKDDYETAVSWYQYAFELGGKTDGSIEKIVTDLVIKNLDRNIAAAQESLAQGDEAAAAQLAELQAQREAQVLDIAKKHVEKYPNDNQFRFELGEAFYKNSLYREAMRELQLGTKQPSVRLRALNYLGLCQKALNMTDLAVKTFANAAAEIPTMDGTKKDLIYNLALTLEAMGKNEEYGEQIKLIYEVDMAYRDVAERVEKFYGL